MLESSVADRADLAGHHAALEPLVTAQGRGGHVSFPAPVASVLGLGVLRVPSSLVSAALASRPGIGQLAPQRVAVLLRLVYVLRQQHRRQKP